MLIANSNFRANAAKVYIETCFYEKTSYHFVYRKSADKKKGDLLTENTGK